MSEVSSCISDAHDGKMDYQEVGQAVAADAVLCHASIMPSM